MHENAISEILTGDWFIEQRSRIALLPRIATILKGESLIQQNAATHTREPKAPVMDAKGLVEFNPWMGGYGVDDIPEGSIAVVPISGTIMKYSSWYGVGTKDLGKLIQRLDDSNNIKAIVLKIDSGGGTVAGTRDFADLIMSVDKPIYAWVDDLAASAALWIAAACDKVWANNNSCEIGSIGVYTTIADFNAYYASKGLPVKDIYSNLSSDKNGPVLKALAGDVKPMQAKLDKIAEEFINHIKTRRIGIDEKRSNPFTGSMYYAPEAMEIGLIDGVGSIREMLGSTDENFTSNTNSQSNMNKLSKAISAFFKGPESSKVSAENVQTINSQLAKDGIAAFVVAATDEIPDHETLVSGLDQSGAEMDRLTGELESAETSIETLTKERDAAKAATDAKANAIAEIKSLFGEEANAEDFDLKAAVETAVKDAKSYHDNPAGGGAQGTGANGVADPAGSADEVNLDELPHNKRADEMGLGEAKS